ncbi:hypothetical protein JYK14_26550 [Siccirubricoccus sp. KC 17139]|uniref:Uncharacterized protein n=1 Tax=Siccirubricoccus soli TaxID=2899147 RepID=A0ABT1DFH1_9PROT|nr:hypothetical protein [Siccirubricoccus soli]MCO6419700.1 hypothetical protein [Siccirubricoccus soli]MCP2685835.1 hypothetical protein [Siccirubricoccus soli]
MKPLPAPSPQRSVPAEPQEEELLTAAGAGPKDRVLVIGGRGVDAMCAALRRGCRSVLGLATPQRHPEAADLVVAPRIASAEAADAIAECARRALPAGGRLALGFSAAGLARGLAGRLKAYGFARARLRAQAEGGALLLCERRAVAVRGR